MSSALLLLPSWYYGDIHHSPTLFFVNCITLVTTQYFITSSEGITCKKMTWLERIKYCTTSLMQRKKKYTRLFVGVYSGAWQALRGLRNCRHKKCRIPSISPLYSHHLLKLIGYRILCLTYCFFFFLSFFCMWRYDQYYFSLVLTISHSSKSW